MEPVRAKTTRSGAWIVVAIIAVATAAILLSLVPAAQATAGNLPPRPTRTPTPTMTPTPTPTPAPQPTFAPPPSPEPRPAEDKAPAGALIELHIHFARQGSSSGDGFTPATASQLWTVVQWQDNSGGWHAVEGWQGAPDQVAGGTATKVWWLSATQLGQGPFRWAVLENYGGQRLGLSAPFSLPLQVGERLEIEVTLAP